MTENRENLRTIQEVHGRFMGETLPGKSPLKELLIEEGNKESEGSNLLQI